MEEIKTTTDEIMGFLKDNMVTRDEFNDLKKEMNTQKLEIIDAIDEKLLNLKADMVLITRNGDKKVVNLINILKNKDVLSDEEASLLLALQPFPQT